MQKIKIRIFVRGTHSDQGQRSCYPILLSESSDSLYFRRAFEFLRNVNNLSVIVAEHPISKKAQSFLSQHIRSVEQLEIFLVLAREPQKAFSVEQIFKQIQSSERSIATALGVFAEQGLAVMEGGDRFRFAEKQESLHQIAAELQSLYRERRVFVIELIYSKSTDSVETFAEAFRLRKKP